MPLDFPSNPVNNQTYDNFIYDAIKGTWKSLSSGASPNYLVNPTITDAVITATANTPSTIPLTVNGAASQSANLQEWKNSAGITLARINSQGSIFSSYIADAPHFDATNLGSSNTDYNYLIRGSNDTGVKATHFINSSTRVNDGGANSYTIRNDGGNLVLGNGSYPTIINGRVSMPNQPSFHAYHSPGGGFSFPTGDVVFNTTRHNVGSYYNTSTGRFTAPVTGQYLFSCHLFKFTSYDNNTNTYWGIRVNGAAVLITNHGVEGQDGGDTISGVISLTAGDYVTIANLNGTMSTFSGEYNSFTGQLLS